MGVKIEGTEIKGSRLKACILKKNTEGMTVTMCFHERLIYCALNKINFVLTFYKYMYSPWLRVLEGGGNFLTKKIDSENQEFRPYPSKHM